jgi:ribosomal-protein-serine acetyltransferase
MTKTVEFLVRYCHEELDINRVTIRAAVGNEKSRAIPFRLGFHEEGITRAAQFIQGKYHDVISYSLLQADR